MNDVQERTLEIVDNAINHIYTERLVQFQMVNQKYSGLRNNTILGFEATISAELYVAIQQQLDIYSVYLEYPGLSRTRIDVAIDASINDLSYCGYIEMKMFYGRDSKCYTNDFEKLKEMVIADKNAVGIQIHFELYQNSKQPNHRLIDGFASSLKPSKYWSNITTIGDSKFHFYRFAFGQQ